ncbi:hypothetical protein GLOTRDRAFT_51544, partial [Gloeophyllum trabeum ATCC 11539]
ALSLVFNFVVTSLIAGRIYYLAWKHRNTVPIRHTRQYMKIIIVLIESGAIFCFAQVVFVMLWAIRSNAHWIGADPACRLYCIVPTLIIVRVGLGVHGKDDATNSIHERSTTREQRRSKIQNGDGIRALCFGYVWNRR